MKFLLDHNLSYRLVRRLRDIFGDVHHVSEYGLQAASDEALWQFARDNEFILVSKDADFEELCLLHSAPSRVVWLRTGNRTTGELADLLIARRDRIGEWLEDSELSILVLDSNTIMPPRELIER